MKPHLKIRKTVKWGGAAVTVLLVVVWIGSCVKTVVWHGRSGAHVCLTSGRVILGYENPRLYRQFGWHLGESGPLVLSSFLPGAKSTSDRWYASLPLWVPAAVSFSITAGAWGVAFLLFRINRRRARLNLCPNCNYDRTGIAAGAVCPECGAAPASSSTT